MFSFTGRVRYSETDQNRRLSMTALLNYFQDCSSFQIEDAGVGFDFLDRQHLAWVVNYWQIDIHRLPHFGDTVVTGTNPYKYKNFMGYRNFYMDTEDGERMVIANSIWSLMNLEKLLPAMITKEHARALGTAAPFDMEYTDRKIPIPKTKGQVFDAVSVNDSMLDSNRHMNNAQYIRIAMMVMGEPDIPGRLCAEYKKQAFPGDVLVPVLYRDGDGSQVVSLSDTDGQPYAVVSYLQK